MGRPLGIGKFRSAFANLHPWAVVAGVAIFSLAATSAVLGEVVLSDRATIAEALNHPPIIVGMDEAHRLDKLWPDGSTTMRCDDLCVDGALIEFTKAARKITGESARSGQPEQKEAVAVQSAYAVDGSQADKYLQAYRQRYNPFALAAKGVRLEARNVHVSAVADERGAYRASWTDVLTDTKANRVVSSRPFTATYYAHTDPSFRSIRDVAHNFAGVAITEIQMGED